MPSFPNSPAPAWYRQARWDDASDKRNGVHYVGDTVTITLESALSVNVTYEVRDYYGTVVSSGSVNSGQSSFDPDPPAGDWDPGWYRVYLSGTNDDANFANSCGATNFCVVRDDPHFVAMPPGDTNGSFQVAADTVMKGVMGVGTTRMTINDASDPTSGSSNIASCVAALADTNTYWVDPGAPYADAARPRYAWVDFPNGAFDQLTFSLGNHFLCKDTTLDGNDVFVEGVTGTNPGTIKINVYYPDAATLVETYDNLPDLSGDEHPQWQAAINGVSDYVNYHWDVITTAAPFAKTAIGRDYHDGVVQVVQSLFPLGCTHYEGPSNEPSMNTQDRTYIANAMMLFAAAVHDGDPDAQAMGPAFVQITNLAAFDTRGWYAFFNAGGHTYCDAISYHAYNAQTNGDSNLGRFSFDAFQQLMDDFSVNLPLWQTESTHNFSSVYGVYHPRRSRVPLLETLLQEQYGVPKEQNNAWYDLSHGFWSYPAWLENEDTSLNPNAVLYRVLAEEIWGKPFSAALDFGTPGNNMFLGNVYAGAAGTTVALMATSFIDGASVTLSLPDTVGPVTVVDGFGNETTVQVVADEITVELTDVPSYVQIGAGDTVSVVTFNDWASTNIGPSLTPDATTKRIDSISYPVIANDAYMTNYETGAGIAPATWATTPSEIELFWGTPQELNRVVIWAGPSWQDSGTLVTFTIESTQNGTDWTTAATVTRPALSYLEFGTDFSNAGCFVETFWDEQWVFDVLLDFSVQALGLRISVEEASYGGEPLPSSGFGQGNAEQAYRIEEIGAFLDPNGPGPQPMTFTYQWQVDNSGGGVYSDIVGATDDTYLLTSSEEGCNVLCEVTATNAAGSVEADSNSLGLVTNGGGGGGGGMVGPCAPWITGDEVAECCSVESSSGALFDQAATAASDLLFELSGRQFVGECGPRTVRPACDSCYCGYQVLSRGHVIGPWDYGYPLYLCDQCMISCSPSMIKLAGVPVRAVSEVLIDGDVLDPSEYTLLNDRYLVRLNDARWPGTQDLTLPDTDDGTFSITYTYGEDPPELGVMAAAQLGCQIYGACGGDSNCVLPAGTTRVIQQGVVVEKLAFTSWAFRGGEWRTGLGLVDAFLGAYNPAGIKRRPVFWAPGHRQYAQGFG